MKTAKEMTAFCDKYDLGKGMNKKWREKHFTLAEEQLAANESVEVCFIGLHNYESIAKHNGYFAYSVTPEKIIITQKKIVGQTIQVISINNLNDITLDTGIVYGILTFDTIKERVNVAVDKITAANIHQMVTNTLFNKISKDNTNNKETSNADEIIKFKSLLDQGIITEEEFNIKKKELLGL